MSFWETLTCQKRQELAYSLLSLPEYMNPFEVNSFLERDNSPYSVQYRELENLGREWININGHVNYVNYGVGLTAVRAGLGKYEPDQKDIDYVKSHYTTIYRALKESDKEYLFNALCEDLDMKNIVRNFEDNPYAWWWNKGIRGTNWIQKSASRAISLAAVYSGIIEEPRPTGRWEGVL